MELEDGGRRHPGGSDIRRHLPHRPDDAQLHRALEVGRHRIPQAADPAEQERTGRWRLADQGRRAAQQEHGHGQCRGDDRDAVATGPHRLRYGDDGDCRWRSACPASWAARRSHCADSLANLTIFELDQSRRGSRRRRCRWVTCSRSRVSTSRARTSRSTSAALDRASRMCRSRTRATLELVEIEASGWWAQLTVKPAAGWQFNVGTGTDDPEIPDGDTAGQPV